MRSVAGVLSRWFAVVALGGALLGTGCVGAEAAEANEPGVSEDLQSGSSQGGPDGASIAATCKVCSIAIACCEAVGGGPECTFSATTCAGLGDAARADYVQGCETFVKTVFTAWKYNPPAECH